MKTPLSNHNVVFPECTFSILALNGLTAKYQLFYAIMKAKSPFPDWVAFQTLLANEQSEEFQAFGNTDASDVVFRTWTGNE